MMRLKQLFHSPIFRFLLVGGGGFILDYGLLIILIERLDFSVPLARLISITFTALIIWPMHRHFSFGASKDSKLKELSRYYGIVGLAALVNFAVFLVLNSLFSTWPYLLIIGISTGIATIVSYLGFRFFAFQLELNSKK